jgi:spore germination cell wall hydrolase CwlJ-like protein
MTISSLGVERGRRSYAFVAAFLASAGVAALALPAVIAEWPRALAHDSAEAPQPPPRRLPNASVDPGAGLSPSPAPIGQSASLSRAEAQAMNASIPLSRAPNPASSPFRLAAGPADYSRAIDCLTAAVYYEAASESLQGQRAVAQVVLNRLGLPAFPKTVCGVVFQGAERSTGCQFTFTCDGSLSRRPSARGWAVAHDVAAAALNGFVEPSVGGATHYHTVWVSPGWSASMAKVANIGAHIFYIWNGAGSPGRAAGVYAGHEPDVAATHALGDTTGVEAAASLIPANLPLPNAAPSAAPVETPASDTRAVMSVRPVQIADLAPPQSVNAESAAPVVRRAATPPRLPVPSGW